MKEPASDIRSTLIWQTYSATGKDEEEVLANVVGPGIASGYATSIRGQPIALIVDYASRVSLIRSSRSNAPTNVKSNEGKQITTGSNAKIIAAENILWLVTQQGSEVVLDKYDENLNLVTSSKVKSSLPGSARLMDAVTRDSGRTLVLAIHDLSPNVAFASVQLITVETATGKVTHIVSADGFNPVVVAHGDEVYFSRVAVKKVSGKQISEVWIGKLSANGKKITEWRSHRQEAGTLFSSLVVTENESRLIGARGYRLFVKRFSKRGLPLGEYHDTAKFQSPLFGYPAIVADNQLFIAQVYAENESRSICGSLRVVGLK